MAADEAPFEVAMREAHARLRAAHSAAVEQLEAELQRSRRENALLRARLAAAGVPEPTCCDTDAVYPAAAQPAEQRRPASAAESTGGASAAPAREQHASEDVAIELERALKALLSQHGLHHLKPERHGSGASAAWMVAGASVHLRFEGPAGGAGGSPGAHRRLLASGDGGRTWEALDALIGKFLSTLQQEPSAGKGPPDTAASPSAATATRQVPTTSLAELAQRPIQRRGSGDTLDADGLPVWRSNGLPAFNDAFPSSFDALSGASNYYSQFRVRVPTNSQYGGPECQQTSLHGDSSF